MSKITTGLAHPLKGVVNTNDDPMACAICSVSTEGECTVASTVMVCCGKSICNSTCLPGAEVYYSCPCCRKITRYSSPSTILSLTKKNAKMGHVWAQFFLATCYAHGADSLRPSDTETFRWAEKSAKKGHPDAMCSIGFCYMHGRGVREKSARAQHWFESALEAGVHPRKCVKALSEMATNYLGLGTSEGDTKGKTLLLSLTAEGPDPILQRAFTLLGMVHEREGSQTLAYESFTSAALSSTKMKSTAVAVHKAMTCALELGKIIEAKYWMAKVTISEVSFVSLESKKNAVSELINFRRKLRQMRDTCGGCGVTFDGQQRKFCRGCHTFCYCSRECQKLHWNRKNGGHREDCKGSAELKRRMKEAMHMHNVLDGEKSGS